MSQLPTRVTVAATSLPQQAPLCQDPSLCSQGVLGAPSARCLPMELGGGIFRSNSQDVLWDWAAQGTEGNRGFSSLEGNDPILPRAAKGLTAVTRSSWRLLPARELL